MVMLGLVGLAGCADSGGGSEDPLAGEEAPPAAGVVRGVVVDEAVVPVDGARVVLEADPVQETETDIDGRFEFRDVPPGSWVLKVSAPGFDGAQSVVTVSEEEGGIVKVQIQHLFDQAPYVEPWQRQGLINCGYSILISAPCVIDYTMILVPGGAAPQLNGATGDVRRFVLPISGGWQQTVTELVWEPSVTATTPALSVTASFFNRTSSHTYDGESGPSPLRMQLDMDPSLEHPAWIPPEGKEDFLLFINPSAAGSDLPFAVSVMQEFEIFHHVFYYGTPPEGWSFIAGDEYPF